MTELHYIQGFHDGMDRYNEGTVLAPTQAVMLLGANIEKKGVISPELCGRIINESITGVQCVQPAWIGGTYYLYYSKDSGIYRYDPDDGKTSTGTLIDAGITGEFSVAVLNDVAYITDGSTKLRDDGTTVSAWGIIAPGSAPTLAVGTHYTKDIELCESTDGWTASGGTISAVTTCYEGTYSLKLWPTSSASFYSAIKTYATASDFTTFANGSTSNDHDYIELYLYYENVKNLNQVLIMFDCNDGTLQKDGFTYMLPISSITSGVVNLTTNVGYGSGTGWMRRSGDTDQSPTPNVETRVTSMEEQTLGYPNAEYEGYVTRIGGRKVDRRAIESPVDVVWKNPIVSPTPTLNQEIVPLINNAFIRHRIPKNNFVRYGETADKGWNTIKGVSIQAYNSTGTNFILFDKIRMVGGGNHDGEYIGMYCFAVADGSGNTLRVSGCSPVSTFVEPSRQKLNWTISTSTDTDVNQRILFLQGGKMGDWFQAGKINDNTSTTYTSSINDWEYQDIIDNYYNRSGGRSPTDANVPQDFTKIVSFAKRIWGFGISGAENYLYPSSLNRGDDMPAFYGVFFPRNEAILNAIPAGQYLHVRTDLQEWRVSLSDPGDISTLSMAEIAGQFPAVGPCDAAYLPQGGIIGISPKAITISNGQTTQEYLEQLTDLPLTGSLDDAAIAFIKSKIYISLSVDDTCDPDMTLLINTKRQTAIPTYLWDRKFDWLTANPKTEKLYGVYGGNIYSLLDDYGWCDEDGVVVTDGTFRIESSLISLADHWFVSKVKLNFVGDLNVYFYMDGELYTSHENLSNAEVGEVWLSGSRELNGRFFHIMIEGVIDNGDGPIIYLPIVIEWDK